MGQGDIGKKDITKDLWAGKQGQLSRETLACTAKAHTVADLWEITWFYVGTENSRIEADVWILGQAQTFWICLLGLSAWNNPTKPGFRCLKKSGQIFYFSVYLRSGYFTNRLKEQASLGNGMTKVSARGMGGRWRNRMLGV